MSNKTFIPAFQCSVGDWRYYIAMMKYGEVARQVTFGHELSKNNELGQLIQVYQIEQKTSLNTC